MRTPYLKHAGTTPGQYYLVQLAAVWRLCLLYYPGDGHVLDKADENVECAKLLPFKLISLT